LLYAGIFLVWGWPLMVRAEPGSGVAFRRDLTWVQVLRRAQQTHKHVFVECMEPTSARSVKASELFAAQAVGEVLNREFLSLALQPPGVHSLPGVVTGRDRDARTVMARYALGSCKETTLLFIAPDGALINRVTGQRSAQEFLKETTKALEYDRARTAYMAGKAEAGSLSFIATMSATVGNEPMARKAIGEYIDSLTAAGPAVMFTRENISLLNFFTRSASDAGFAIFYWNREAIDKLMGRGPSDGKSYAQRVIDRAIIHDDISPYLPAAPHDEEPDWEAMRASIARKYTEALAGWNVTNTRLEWERRHRKWPQVCNTVVSLVKDYREWLTDMELNNYAWYVVIPHCTETAQLQSTIAWMAALVWSDPTDYESMDTYAVVLYKAGRRSEALKWGAEAWDKSRHEGLPDGIADIQTDVEKIKSGVPLWPVP
jgi:hypothetical protein